MTSHIPLCDLHCHLVPGVDDGARTLEEALAALAAMRDQGVRRLVTTPHLEASVTHRPEVFAERMERFDRAWESFRSAAAELVPEITLGRGHEIMLDVPDVRLEDARTRIDGTPYVLVEFPRLGVPSGSADALYRLRVAGYRPIVAHPERYVTPEREGFANVEEWRRMGALMAVNAGSILGGFGRGARGIVRELLRRGWVDLVGSDYHSRPSRPLVLREAWETLVQQGGEEQARLLLAENPRCILSGEEVQPVPPFAGSSGVMGRMRRLIGF
jgi:protein-tyrosine phosphatase